MRSPSAPVGIHRVRRQQPVPEGHHESFKIQRKPSEAAACPSFWATYHGGRWQCAGWPNGSQEVHCPACDRLRDDSPVGIARIGRKFFIEHRQELSELIRQHEAKARAKHPRGRIVAIEDSEHGMLVTTTDIDLARDLGVALHQAYQGELELHYDGEKKLLRVHWRR